MSIDVGIGIDRPHYHNDPAKMGIEQEGKNRNTEEDLSVDRVRLFFEGWTPDPKKSYELFVVESCWIPSQQSTPGLNIHPSHRHRKRTHITSTRRFAVALNVSRLSRLSRHRGPFSNLHRIEGSNTTFTDVAIPNCLVIVIVPAHGRFWTRRKIQKSVPSPS